MVGFIDCLYCVLFSVRILSTTSCWCGPKHLFVVAWGDVAHKYGSCLTGENKSKIVVAANLCPLCRRQHCTKLSIPTTQILGKASRMVCSRRVAQTIVLRSSLGDVLEFPFNSALETKWVALTRNSDEWDGRRARFHNWSRRTWLSALVFRVQGPGTRLPLCT